MSEPHLVVDVTDGVATLTMNRPESLNALSPEMVQGLIESTARFERDAAVRCVVLRGAGNAFMAGGDVKGFYRDLVENRAAHAAGAEERVVRVHQLIYHVRRMYGGGLYQAWPYAAVALHYLQGFEERFARAVAISEDWIRRMAGIDGISIERIPSGTNLFRLRLTRGNTAAFQQQLLARGIALGDVSNNGAFTIGVNETLLRTTPAELTEAFTRAIG